MTPQEARAITYNLGEPSKMPGYSFGIPASRCKLGAILKKQDGTVCSECYADHGRYVFDNVQNALEKRFQGLRHPQWVEAMIIMLSQTHVRRTGYFRWFDSGDLQSVEMLGKICKVAEGTKFLRHWMATREHTILRDYVESGESIPHNLVIRLSATKIDGRTPTNWKWTSTVFSPQPRPSAIMPNNRLGKICRARSNGNTCGTCRACWSHRVQNVSYPLH